MLRDSSLPMAYADALFIVEKAAVKQVGEKPEDKRRAAASRDAFLQIEEEAESKMGRTHRDSRLAHKTRSSVSALMQNDSQSDYGHVAGATANVQQTQKKVRKVKAKAVIRDVFIPKLISVNNLARNLDVTLSTLCSVHLTGV